MWVVFCLFAFGTGYWLSGRVLLTAHVFSIQPVSMFLIRVVCGLTLTVASVLLVLGLIEHGGIR